VRPSCACEPLCVTMCVCVCVGVRAHIGGCVAQVEQREREHPSKKVPSYFSDEKVVVDGGFGLTEAYLAGATVLCVLLLEVRPCAQSMNSRRLPLAGPCLAPSFCTCAWSSSARGSPEPCFLFLNPCCVCVCVLSHRRFTSNWVSGPCVAIDGLPYSPPSPCHSSGE
jgi:hypothetical protein